MPHFLFPASPLNPRTIDEAFQDQATALKQAGFGTSVIDNDGFVRPKLEPGVTCVYRGWMMTPEEYGLLHRRVVSYGVGMLTSPEQYIATHYLPNWYPKVAAYTPKSAIFPSLSFDEPYPLDDDVKIIASRLEEFVRTEGAAWEKFQIKDYVKSLKTAGGSAFTSPGEIAAILENMRKYRGIIEGGIVLRRWEDFFPGSEKRYFVINGRYFSQEFSFDTRAMRILARVHHLVTDSPFYSMDIAQPKDSDEFRLVEIGDGQVSDLVGWTPERFAEIWK